MTTKLNLLDISKYFQFLALMRLEPVGVISLSMEALALMLGMHRHPVGSQEGNGHMRLVPLLQSIHHLQSIHYLQSIHHLLSIHHIQYIHHLQSIHRLQSRHHKRGLLDALELRMGVDVKTRMDIQLALRQLLLIQTMDASVTVSRF